MPLTSNQILAIDITEKTGSVFSVLGEAFVISTFLFSSKFRKPINRLVFYAAWGNIFANVATLIGRTAISIGVDSPLCQFQSFLIQWFMAADALWIFAMACNVWLSFFHHYDAPQLKALEWKYFLLCYGLPFPPAFIFIFVTNDSRGRVYGDAVLWCWFSLRWDFLRVAIFYAPVWIVILLTIAIYVRVGAFIWRWRRQMASLGKQSDEERHRTKQEIYTPTGGIRRTDEVTITQEMTVQAPLYTLFRSPLPTSTPETVTPNCGSPQLSIKAFGLSCRTKSRGSKGPFRGIGSHANKATIKYCKCALLFFMALLITWVPSTINRIYTLAYPGRLVFGLHFAASLVLPLQGFWNAVIYIATSVFACKCLWKDTMKMFGLKDDSDAKLVHARRDTRVLSFESRNRWRADSDTNSLKSMHRH